MIIITGNRLDAQSSESKESRIFGLGMFFFIYFLLEAVAALVDAPALSGSDAHVSICRLSAGFHPTDTDTVTHPRNT